MSPTSKSQESLDALIRRNGFAVVPSHEFFGMAEVYTSLKDRSEPIFVTTDAMLHTAHLFFDYLLRILEISSLRPQLVELTKALLDASSDDLGRATDSGVIEAARRNLAFFSVGTRLLEPESAHPISKEVDALVEAELELIAERAPANPPPSSAVLGIREDYTQYVARGHYTRNDAFRTFFLTMTWYGRMGFFVFPSESHQVSEHDVERLARQALLISRNLHRQKIGERAAIDVWRSIYQTTALFAGRGEDPGPDEYLAAAERIYGGLPDLADLADTSRLRECIDKLRELPRPRVLGTYYLSKTDPDSITPRWQDGTLGFHFMPQRFVPDSHILSELTWDRVGNYVGTGTPFTLFRSPYDGPYRAVPRGLDVLAAFGSRLAERILEDEGDVEYEGYAQKLSELREQYAGRGSDRDLYHRWLGVLQALLELPENAPAFMLNAAWQCKQLNAALGSWAELRHDTILYVKQSYTSAPRGLSSGPPAFLEPQVQVYARLGSLISSMREELGDGMLTAAVDRQLAAFEAMLDEMTRIAEKELRGEALDREETLGLQSIGRQMQDLLRFPRELMEQITSGTDDEMAVVADVHSHLEGGVVLEEAVGDPFLICVEIERDGRPARYWGAVFSYYEFKQPIDDRLTDEAWQAMTPKPPLPPWTARYLA